MATASEVKCVEVPFPGHLCVSDKCRWFKNTQVGGLWAVSSIGEWHPENSPNMRSLSSNPEAFYETKVFELMPKGKNHKGHGMVYKSFYTFHEQESTTKVQAEKAHKAAVEIAINAVLTGEWPGD